jgi:hypothetical protein
VTEYLYRYRCPNCGQTYLTAVPPVGKPVQCQSDRTWLRFLYRHPIETDADRALAKQCPMWNGRPRNERYTTRQCDECPAWVEKATMVRLGAGGNYCSAACADIGTEKHRAAVEAVKARVEKLYQEMPWLRPQEKETA